jgi:hypothetical protein
MAKYKLVGITLPDFRWYEATNYIVYYSLFYSMEN